MSEPGGSHTKRGLFLSSPDESVLNMSSSSFSVQDEEGLAGVGLVLGQDVVLGDSKIDGPIIVEALVPGGAAEGCGLIQVNDLLEQVDSVCTSNMEAEQVSRLIIGRVGTMVRLLFRRPPPLDSSAPPGGVRFQNFRNMPPLAMPTPVDPDDALKAGVKKDWWGFAWPAGCDNGAGVMELVLQRDAPSTCHQRAIKMGRTEPPVPYGRSGRILCVGGGDDFNSSVPKLMAPKKHAPLGVKPPRHLPDPPPPFWPLLLLLLALLAAVLFAAAYDPATPVAAALEGVHAEILRRWRAGDGGQVLLAPAPECPDRAFLWALPPAKRSPGCAKPPADESDLGARAQAWVPVCPLDLADPGSENGPCETPGAIRVSSASYQVGSAACVTPEDLAACPSGGNRAACWSAAFARRCSAHLVHRSLWVREPAAPPAAGPTSGVGSLVPLPERKLEEEAFWQRLPPVLLGRLGAKPAAFSPAESPAAVGMPVGAARGPMMDLLAELRGANATAAAGGFGPCAGAEADCATWRRRSVLTAEIVDVQGQTAQVGEWAADQRRRYTEVLLADSSRPLTLSDAPTGPAARPVVGFV